MKRQKTNYFQQSKNMLRKKYFSILAFLFLVIFAQAQNQTDTALVFTHLKRLTEEVRNYNNITQLNQTAKYIETVFRKYSDSIFIQDFVVNGHVYKNVICSFGVEHIRRVIVGAHYDVYANQEGADDNASGVVALLELARQLKGQKLNFRVDLVAYTLEEPPFFRSELMGSYIHAKYLKDKEIDVYGVVAVEMIGYFKDEKKTQDYPIGMMSLFYGSKGNYISLVRKFGSGKFARKFGRKFKSSKVIRTKKLSAPKFIPGIDFSDHLNYWKFGYSALMITDTAFYRNKNYHKTGDTLSTLDIPRMALVIDGIFRALVALK